MCCTVIFDSLKACNRRLIFFFGLQILSLERKYWLFEFLCRSLVAEQTPRRPLVTRAELFLPISSYARIIIAVSESTKLLHFPIKRIISLLVGISSHAL